MAEIIAVNPMVVTNDIIHPEIEIQYLEPDPDKFHPVDFITGLVDYLNMLGYGVSQECACQFFAIGGNLADMDQAECLLKPLIVKNGAQSETFHRDFRQFLKRRHAVVVDAQTERKLQKHMSEQARLETRLEACNFTIQAGEREAERLRKEAEKQAKQTKGDPKLEKAYKKVEKSYKNVSGKLKDAKLRDKLRRHATGSYKPQTDDEFDQMKDALTEMLKHAISCADFKNLMAFIKAQASRLKKEQESQRMSAASALQAKEKQLAQAKKEQEKIQQQLDETVNAMKNEITLVHKVAAVQHRQEFGRARNAVQARVNGEPSLLDKQFDKLTAKQKLQIKDYIRENAMQFKTRLLRNINTTNKEKLNISETCRKACETGGIPLRLYFQKKAKQQAKVILFLDISGSCKEVSELMLFFMYTMREVFPGGCRTYVFVNSLYDVSGYMEADNADAAVKAVMDAIPRAGAYSDYYKPFQAFYEGHMSEVNNDTLVFFIGDARNNKNESGEEFVKAISRKCKKAFWMNADPYNKWDQGDSIISIYAKYMRMVGEVLTPNQLIEFLMKI